MWKEIIKIRAEINEMEIKNNINNKWNNKLVLLKDELD
jgi:hypothetical protein